MKRLLNILLSVTSTTNLLLWLEVEDDLYCVGKFKRT